MSRGEVGISLGGGEPSGSSVLLFKSEKQSGTPAEVLPEVRWASDYLRFEATPGFGVGTVEHESRQANDTAR